jgi:O-succinylbenzoic acid--CoA ligase
VDDVVISGGVNVDLAAVERAALDWPDRDGDIVLVGVPHEEWGVQIIAVTDGRGSESDLRSYLRLSLHPAAVPRRLARVSPLPRTSSGKIDRQRLIADLTTELEKTT